MTHKKNCYFLYGEDIVAVNTRQKEILKNYFTQGNPEITVFESDGTYEAYKNRLKSQSLFSENIAVIINNPFFLKKKSQSEKEEKEFLSFLNVLSKLNDDTLVIIAQEGKIDKRIKNFKLLMNICNVIECAMLKSSAGIEKMVEKFQKNGKTLSYDAREYLEEVLSSWSEISESLLTTECDKILLMADKSKVIDRKLLEEALPDYMNQVIFRYADQLFSKNIAAILQNTDHVFYDTSSEIKNIGFISSQLRKIKIIKEMQREGKSSSEISNKLKIKSQWQMKRLMQTSRKLKENEVEELILDLFEYQYEQRHGQTERTIKDVFLKFCRKSKGGNL